MMETRPFESQRQASDSELIAGVVRKEESAVRELIRRHNQGLYCLARSIVRDDQEAEDVLQEVYLRAFSRISSFRGESALATWLGRIVLNEALMHRRRHRPSIALIEAARMIVERVAPTRVARSC